MNEPLRVREEVRELLGELACDQGAHLLRLTSQQSRAILYERDPKASPGGAFLAPAERKLLEGYRDEAARILQLYAKILRHAAPADPGWHSGEPSVKPPDPAKIGARARRLAQWSRGADLGADVLDLLEQCTNAAGPGSVQRVMAASIRLRPSFKARVALATDSLMAGSDVAGAERTLQEAIEQSPFDADRSYAWESMGWTAYSRSDLGSAAEAYRNAAEALDERAVPLLSWLNCAILSGDESNANAASKRVDGALGVDHPAVDWFIERCVSRAAATHQYASPTVGRLLHTLSSRAGATTRRILHALRT